MGKPQDFLANHLEPCPWQLLHGGRIEVFKPFHLFVGQGDFALEVAAASTSSRPNVSDVRQLWKYRRVNRAAPVLRYPCPGSLAVSKCGPVGDGPRVLADRDAC